jgi:hypothetical protein
MKGEFSNKNRRYPFLATTVWIVPVIESQWFCLWEIPRLICRGRMMALVKCKHKWFPLWREETELQYEALTVSTCLVAYPAA